MNYILSFCKITGSSRIFSRNFYLPLLKPQTPKDALRTFKITGKWLLSSKTQHYIPVLFNHKRKRSKQSKDYGKVGHKLMKGYTYLKPVFDPDDENHKALLEILRKKKGRGKFVYTVEDKKHNLVVSADLELAIRDGDVVDVLVSQTNNKILVKLNNFKKVPIDLENFKIDELMYNGEGETTPEEEKNHHHGKFAMSIARIFEAKERELDDWEMELIRIISKRKKQHGEGTLEWNEMVKESIERFDWKRHERDARNVIDTIFEPAREEHIAMQVRDFDVTRNVSEKILGNGDAALVQLPKMCEIPEVVKNMSSGVPHEIAGCVSGVKVTLSSGKECFVTGQMVKTDEGDVFVPGQTVENEFGVEYAPGMTINMDDKPTLITGLIMGDENGERPMFLPTDSTITADGQLTFTTNPEERPEPVPKPEREEPRADHFSDAEPDVGFIVAAADESEESPPSVSVSEISFESDGEIGGDLRECDALDAKMPDDGMGNVVASVEKKTSRLQEMLDELRRSTVCCEDDLVTYVTLDDAREVASTVTGDEDKAYRLADIFLTLTRRAATFRERSGVNVLNIHNPTMVCPTTYVTEADERFQACGEALKIALKTTAVAANDIFKKRPKDQMSVLKTIGKITRASLDENVNLDELCALMNTPGNRNEVCTAVFKQLTQEIRENKVDALRGAVEACKRADVDASSEKLIQIIEDDETLTSAFKKLAKLHPELVEEVVDRVKKSDVKTEIAAVEVVVDAVAGAVAAASERWFTSFLWNSSEYEHKDLVYEAAGLSKALCLQEIYENLSELMMDADASVLRSDKNTLDFLKRVVVMRKLSERDYSLKTSLVRIKRNPECGGRDPRIRRLVLESASLASRRGLMRTSKEVPLRLFQARNFLAIEDYVARRAKPEHPLLVSRSGFQAVVPKEAAKDVLASRVPYALVDETGVTHFKPMHVYAAPKMDKREKRFAAGTTTSRGGGRHEEYVAPKRSPTEVRNRVRRQSLNNRMVA